MIIGVLSDTHRDRMGALPHIIREFQKRDVELIVHCGDIEEKHLDPNIFGNLPVVCALIEEQLGKEAFKVPPKDWVFTKPGTKNRICPIDSIKIYVGHKKAFEFIKGTGTDLQFFLDTLRRDNDGLLWAFAGHTHHQIFLQNHRIAFVNPGAVSDSFDGHEFSIVDTETGQIVFSRIPSVESKEKSFSIGVISDSLDISRRNPSFWEKLACEFKERDVSHIVHCGNIHLRDVGHPSLRDFHVHYNLRKGQIKPKGIPVNWELIQKSVVEIRGHRFLVQLDLGINLFDQSEISLNGYAQNWRREYPEISYVLCGFTNDAFLEEGEQVRIINPGDVNMDQSFAVICLPRAEITFGRVPFDPLPPLEK